jgi:hypothetical protein
MLLLCFMQVKDTEEAEFLRGRAEIIDEMEAMLPTATLNELNQQLRPFLHFLTPCDEPPDPDEQQQETELAAVKREVLGQLYKVLASQQQLQQWHQKQERLVVGEGGGGGGMRRGPAGSCGGSLDGWVLNPVRGSPQVHP